MAENYGSLEGVLDANETLEGEIDSHDEMSGEIQFSGGANGVRDVKVNGESVVDENKVANIDLTPYAEKEDVYDKDAIDTALQAIDTALEGKADTDDIPKKLSDLTDDENHRLVTDTEKNTWDNKADESDIPTVNNPTITIQKNNQNIDSFTLNQDSNKSINISVPTKTSDLQNDDSFITNTVNNLANYYLKSDTYTQTEVNNLISAAVNGRFEKVTTLPASGEPNVIYLVPKTTALTNNVYDEYIWQDNTWELLGSTEIDLSNYVTTTDLATALADYVTSSTFNTTLANYYTKTEVGNLLDGKVDKVSGKGLSTNDYDNTAKGIVDGVTNALAGKVDKVNGKGLSTEDYTTTEKNKLAGISTGANKVESSTTNGNIKIDGTETQVYDGSGKADKVTSAVNGNLAGLNGSGNPTDSGISGDMTTTSVSGNPLSISGLKSSQLAVNPVITFEPIQAGSGTPSPSNIRAISGYDKIEVLSGGVNLIFDYEKGGIDSQTGADNTNVNACRTGYIRVSPNTSYYFIRDNSFGGRMYPSEYDSGKKYLRDLSNFDAETRTITTSVDCHYIRIAFFLNNSGWGTNLPNRKDGFNYPATQTSYVASNKTTDLSESLGQTVYGASWTVRNGKLVSNLGFYTFDGSESWTISGVSAYFEIATMKQGLNMSGYCSKLVTGGSAGQLQLGNNNKRIYLVSISEYGLSTASDVQTFMTGVQLAYPLATPTEIQLTPHEIALSQDYAYISTNGTLIALDYHNGEMASLADVSQLGETVNNLNDNVTNGELTDLVKQGNYGIFYYELKKSGRLVELYLELYNVRYTTLTRIANLPTGFIPAHRKTANIIATDSGTGLIQKGFMRVEVTNTGEIQAAFMGSTSENIFADVTLMYYV